MKFPVHLQQKLQTRNQEGILRQLKTNAAAVDFCSNDYLGLAHSPKMKEALEQELLRYPDLPVGATGSRLLSGNNLLTEELEDSLALFHQSEAALLFNSGYAANTGFFSAVPQRGDTILYDEASHASIKDGIRLSFAKAYSFRHNAVEDLKKKMQQATGTVYVAVEALYSMDGDFAPLPELAFFCKDNGAYLVVDEAHSNGIYGVQGEGLVYELNLQTEVFARILTFGKALGSHGAIVVGSQELKNFLVNFSRPFIYSTALPLHTILAIKCAYTLLPILSGERQKVKELATDLGELLVAQASNIQINMGESPIKAIRGFSTAALKKISDQLIENGFDVRPIFSPTVPEGKEQLRVILHAYNTKAEINQLVSGLTS